MKSIGYLAAAGIATALSTSAALAAESGVKVGVLSCTLAGKTNVVVYVKETFDCSYVPEAGTPERYDGTIQRVGVDLEFKPTQNLIWAVIAPTTDLQGGALAGTYGGASVSATVGAGVGGKVLVGGFEKSITLQPLSITGQTGFGAAAGVEGFTLTAK